MSARVEYADAASLIVTYPTELELADEVQVEDPYDRMVLTTRPGSPR